jgi:hypothetical protein
MKKYKVLVRGENFLINVDGCVKKLGFYTTRFVEANDDREAEDNALSLLRTDSKLRDCILNEESDTPMLC